MPNAVDSASTTHPIPGMEESKIAEAANTQLPGRAKTTLPAAKSDLGALGEVFLYFKYDVC